jgi:hypothetical protein
MAKGSRQLDGKLKLIRRIIGKSGEHGGSGRAIEREIQLNQRKGTAVVGQHLPGASARRIKVADPIRIGITGSADPHVHDLPLSGVSALSSIVDDPAEKKSRNSH